MRTAEAVDELSKTIREMKDTKQSLQRVFKAFAPIVDKWIERLEAVKKGIDNGCP